MIDNLLSSWEELTEQQQASLMVYQAIQKSYKGDYWSSKELLLQVQKYKVTDELLISIYQYQTANLIALRQYTEAFDLMAKYLEKISSIHDIETKAGAYVRLSNLALNLDANEELRKYSSQALLFAKGTNAKLYCFSLILSAYADYSEFKYSDAKEGFNQSKNFCDNNELPLFGFVAEKGLAEIAIKTDDFENANRLLNNALAGYKKFSYKTEITSVYALLAKTNFRLSQYSQAEEFANKVMDLSDDPSHIVYKAIAAKVLSQRYFELKQYQLAYDYLESHQYYTNLIHDDTKAKANAYQMAKFKHQEQAREIALLNQERQLVEAQKELDQADRTNDVMIMTMLVGSVIFLSLFLLYSHRQKLRYRKLALTDRLTGVYNRGAGQDFAENEFVQVCMRKAHFSVVVLDLDLFKNINDSFGHATGDWTLKHVVSVIKPLIRDSDILTRMGGEEFALFLPYSCEQTALKIAERCKDAIEAIDTKYSGHLFNITASFGVSSNNREDLSLDPVLKRADIALYASKHSGRNRVTLYTPELELQCKSDETQRSLIFN
ncbi:GGDEF domain-containing protein [Shewanella schlegeliana]|uniref:tetratricopeptide repeat-containing diguanylate cyclase n=1 Tax=Shewanella schlegeliana TaxID=190308 RepID=UPI001ED92F59|nr:GGDEF domain-containing protein [Shewanella schlegeliana]MCL1110869.1 GGDEF domain-containing protein [Shewanella schlegeliana]